MKHSLTYYAYLSIILGILTFPSCDSLVEKGGSTKVFYNNVENKFWGHRINDPDLANDWLRDFKGVELDVHYNLLKRNFKVKHDDDKLAEFTLSEYIEKLENREENYLWLDLKNLNWLTSSGIVLHLNRILEKYEMKDRVIVESSRIWKLDELNKSGLYTAYWAPHLERNHSMKDSLACIETIRENIVKYDFNAISIHYTMYRYFNKHFPEQNYIVWTNDIHNWARDTVLDRFNRQANINVILVDSRDRDLALDIMQEEHSR